MRWREATDAVRRPVETAICKVGVLALVELQWFDVSIDYDLAPEAPVTLADKIQIQPVLVNLMRNSLEALPSIAAAQRTLCAAPRMVKTARIAVLVSDNGPGPARPVRTRLFPRFYSTCGERIERVIW